jgi:hypothetical protein
MLEQWASRAPNLTVSSPATTKQRSLSRLSVSQRLAGPTGGRTAWFSDRLVLGNDDVLEMEQACRAKR